MTRALLLLLLSTFLPLAQAQGLPEGAIARLGASEWRHPGGIEGLAYAGAQLVGVGPLGVRIWDGATGKTRHQLAGAGYGVAASPDGKRVLVAGASLRWIDASSGKVERAIAAPAGRFDCCAWSPDGASCYAGTNKGLLLATAADGTERWRAEAKGSNSSGIAVSPDGKTLAVCLTGEAAVGLFDSATGKRRKTIDGAKNWIYRVAYSADGSMLAGGGANALLMIWDAGSGALLYRTPGERLVGMRPTVGVAFAGDVVLQGVRYVERVRALVIEREGKSAAKFTPLRTTFPGSILTVSPDGKTMASAEGALVQRTDIATRRRIGPELEELRPATCLAWSKDGKQLLTGDWGRLVKSWTTGGELLATIEVKGDLLQAVALSPDGALVAAREEPPGRVLMGGEVIRIWRRSDSRLLQEFKTTSRFSRTRPHFSPDGTLLAYGGLGREVQLWEVATGKARESISCDASVQAVRWSSDGKQLISVIEGGAVDVWSAASGERVERKPLPKRTWITKQEFRRALSADWSVVAVTLKTGAVAVSDVDSGALRGIVAAAGRGWPNVACSPDGKWLAIAGPGASFRLVDARTAKVVRTVPAGAPVSVLAFSPHGLLATALRGGTTLIWKVSALAK